MKCAWLAIFVTAAGCETRVISNPVPLGNLPGSTSGEQYVAPPRENVVPTVADDQVVVEEKGKKPVLKAGNANQLLYIIRWCLENKGGDEAFATQVLSDQTRREFESRGLDPKAALAMIQRRQRDFDRLQKLLPSGEFTPGVFVKSLGGGVKRLESTSPAARRTAWYGIDIVWEKEGYRFVWFVGGDRPREVAD